MISKAVIPAAGFGTRFLPITKTQPKEMLPIVDTPTIQYVVEEAVNSGVRDILIITALGKSAIENHFDRAFELEAHLHTQGREEQRLQVRNLASMANIHFIRQRELNGLGDAISYARWHVGDEAFLVLLGDTLVDSQVPCSRQLIDVYNRLKSPIIGVEEVPPQKVERYGIVGGEAVEPNTWRIEVMVEKPKAIEAPSNLAIGGRYILTPDIFDYIEKTARGVNNEVQLTDALQLMHKDRAVYAHKFEGVRHDIGNRLDYMRTSVKYAAKRKDIGTDFKAFLKEFVAELD
ncbi:UTP--glucose-1-phosphate uridylyltransferase GalU [Candidatus Sumerlaeota bacterium]|nr:UTP--glucose-1-phosphate uridylyltransferase GalU [Candidatus Sumerlaeota bacterium]